MKVSLHWLREWVDPALDGKNLAEKLTMAGLEVSQLTPVAPPFDGIVVGLVESVERHPDAERLSVCQGFDGKERFTIVCGASNVCADLKVALAKIGARLPNGMEIKKAKLRGVVSEGMLCSATELGIASHSDGIMILPKESTLGQDLRQALDLDDTVLDLELTPNRGDCLSVAGLAREIAALTETSLRKEIEISSPILLPDLRSVLIEDPAGCPHYVGRVLREIPCNIPTPLWLKERLQRSGIHSISLIVDVTNYVMLELGQPLHAFDLNKLSGNISVRRARLGESLTLLGGTAITLNHTALVIADDRGPVALAGVMGGEHTAVSPETCDIFLESAYFAPLAISGKAKIYGLSSDASYRFERGVDPLLQIPALERATQLILSLAGGKAGPLTEVSCPEYIPTSPKIYLRKARVDKVLGEAIPEQTIKTLLQRLGFLLKNKEDGFEVEIPTYRSDITLEACLIEEIVRLYGYDKISCQSLQGELKACLKPEASLAQAAVTLALVARGYSEAITYSFIDQKWQSLLYPTGDALSLLNPLSTEVSEMRKGLWVGLLKALLYNQNRQHTCVRLFEWGTRFLTHANKIKETKLLAGVCAGLNAAPEWGNLTRNIDFYDVKGDLEIILASTHKKEHYTFVTAAHPALHPGQSACIYLEGVQVGWIGVLHPDLIQAFNLTAPVIVFELEILGLGSTLPQYRKISKFPSIRRDLSFILEKSIPASNVLDVITQEGHELLQSIELFDVYQGEHVPSNKRSLAISLTLQHAERTLVETEVSEWMDLLLQKLKNQFDIILRE